MFRHSLDRKLKVALHRSRRLSSRNGEYDPGGLHATPLDSHTPRSIAIIRDNDNLSALETTLAPTPWIMLNRKQPSLKICERVLGVLGKEETEHEAVANTVVRREAQAIRDSLLYC